MKTDIETIKTKDCTWRVRDKVFATFLLALSMPFSSFLSHPPHQRIKKGKKKALWEMKTTESSGTVYLVKVYRNTNLLSQLKEIFNGSKASREFQVAHEVAERHIPTFLPIAVGVKKKKGLIQESYLVIEKVAGCTDLAKYLLRDREKIGREKKRTIAVHLGQLIRNIHQQGILQIDLALNNFLVKPLETGEPDLFFSDFEKVKFLPVISQFRRFEGLARLNRVGKEICIADRLKFLQAYLYPEYRDRKKFHAAVRYLQSLTLATLKRDGLRRRMTSVYTDCFYKTHRDDEFHGYYLDGYRVEELLNAAQNLEKKREGEINVEITFQGSPVRMKAKSYRDNLAARVWSNAFTLFLGTIPVILPVAFFKKEGMGAGCIFSPVEETVFRHSDFLPRIEPEDIVHLSRLLSALNQFGTFSGRISENTFVFQAKDHAIEPCLSEMHSFSIQRKTTSADREKDLTSLITLFASLGNKTQIEHIIRSSYFKKKGLH